MRTITTAEELRSLPDGAIFIADGDAFQKVAGHPLRAGDDQSWSVDDLKANGFWPLTVLWPEAEATP